LESQQINGFTWEALRPFANEVVGDIKAYGRTK
jgi:hypothetical protein